MAPVRMRNLKRHPHPFWWLVVALLVAPGGAPGVRAQESPMQYQRWNTFNVNRVSTLFNNTGLLSDGNQQNRSLARTPAFEFPTGSGLHYGTSIGVVIGAPAEQDPGAVDGNNPDNLPYLDATIDEGSAAFWNEEHFAPYAVLAGNERAPMSTDPASWPQWPATYPDTDAPLVVGSEGWPGFGPGGERIADQESFGVAYAWKGTDAAPGEVPRGARWLRTQLVSRGLAWQGTLYENFLVFAYVVRNTGTAPIRDMRVGIHADLGFLPNASVAAYGDADRHYYDPALQLAYGWDDNSYEENPVTGAAMGADDIAWGGVIALEMPGPSEKVETYDAFHFWVDATTPKGNGASLENYYHWNLKNLNDPHDSDLDGIDDDFDLDGVPDAAGGGPGYYLADGADGVQTLGSGAFTLAPGETDTLIFAVVFGENRDALFTNARRARTLYESGWKVVKAPEAPVVEAVPGDGNVTLYWNRQSEQEEDFQGYKVYRSADEGKTWGSRSFNDFDGGVHYVPMAQFDLVDDVAGNYRTLPEYAWFDLGDDTGLPREVVVDEALAARLQHFSPGDTLRVFTDDEAVNGQRYRYYVAAYDSGNVIIGPLENTPVTAQDKLAEANNTVEVIPHAPGPGADATSEELEKVRVVPNPYVVANALERGTSRQLQFTHLPDRCTIRIYNVAGELVRELQHEGAGSLAPSIERWDLLNTYQQLVAPGLYFYYVEAPSGGSQTGKFIIIH